MIAVYSSPYPMIVSCRKALLKLSATVLLGAMFGSFALAGDVSTQNASSRFTNNDPAQSDHYKYYLSSSSSSHVANPNDRMYDGLGPDLFFPNGTTVRIWRNGVIEQCNDWGSLSSAVPQSTWTYIFKNNDGCRFTTPNYLKKDKPTGHIDAQIHYDINWGALDSDGPNTWNGRLYYRTSLNSVRCYPSGNTVSSPSQCPSGSHKYRPDDNYGGNHDVEVIDYEIFRCGDGLVQNGQSYDNGQTANEVCDPGDDPTCKSDCSGFQSNPVCEDTILSTNGPLTVGQSVTISCQGTDIDSYRIDIKKDWNVIQQETISSNGSYTFTPSSAGNYQFQCVPLNVPSGTEWCPNREILVQTPQQPDPVCEDISVSPLGNIEVGEQYTVVCEGTNFDAMSILITYPNGNTNSQEVLNAPGGIGTYTFTANQVGSYQFSCIVGQDDGDNDQCPTINGTVNQLDPGVCGPVDGEHIYDFYNLGDALNQSSSGLCPAGQTVVNFSYDQYAHEWTWQCEGPGGLSDVCEASEKRCGDGNTDTPDEQCDDGNTNDNDACNNSCELITTDPVCMDTAVNPQGDIAAGEQYTITCVGQDINTFTIEVEIDGTVVQTYDNVGPDDPISYTVPANTAPTSTLSFQCIPSDPSLPPSEWCDKEYRGIVDDAFECIDTSVTPIETELDETGDSDEFTITCEGIGVETWKVDVIDEDTNNVITSLMNPVSSSSTQAVFTYNPSVVGNYLFSCRAMTPTQAEDCPFAGAVVTEPGEPGICGEKDGDYIYDFDNTGDALDESSDGLCPDGQAVVQFNYLNHEWIWKCENDGETSELCEAREQRCGDGDVNGNEQCDDGNTNNNDACNNNCEIITSDPICIDTAVTPQGDIEVGQQYTISCVGQDINTFTIEVELNGNVVQTYNDISPNDPVNYTIPNGTDPTATFSFQCIPSDPTLAPSEWCDKEYRGIVDNAFECIDTSVTPTQTELDETGDSDEFTITCEGIGVETWKVDVIDQDTNNVITSLMNPVSSSSTQAVFTYNPSVVGNYLFSCRAMTPTQAEDCPFASAVVTEPGEPGICGEKDGDYIYDFDNDGDALDENSPWLCPDGQTVVQFNYTDHEWTWKCENDGETSDVCSAWEQRCGDGEVNSPDEQCDDGNTDDNDGCTNTCTNGEPELYIEKSANTTTIVPGDTVEYIISFWNQGDSVAEAVRVTDEMPEGFFIEGTPTFDLDAGVQGSPSISIDGNDVTLEGFDLAPGQGGTLTVVARIEQEGCGFCNIAIIDSLNQYAEAAGSHVFCNQKPDLDKKQRNVTVGGSLTDSQILVSNGDIIEYEIIFSNDGAEMTNELLIDVLPDEVVYNGDLDVSVNGDADVSCDYDQTVHQIICPVAIISQGAEVTLLFTVEVIEDLPDQNNIVNTVSFAGLADLVIAVGEPKNPDGTIIKTVDNTEGEVGDIFTYTITFVNEGDVDLVEYKIMDYWPAELGLVSFDDVSPFAPSSITVDELPSPCVQYEGGENCAKLITYMFDTPLAPGESVDIVIEAEGLVESYHVINTVEVWYKDDHGDEYDGYDEDDEHIVIILPAGECNYVDTELAGVSMTTDTLPVVIDVHCFGDGNPADTIEIDCGNGDGIVFSEQASAVYGCTYSEEGEYFAQCFFNGEPVAKEQCVAPISIEVEDDSDELGICGNGKKNLFESCDLGISQIDGSVRVGLNGIIFQNQPWIERNPYAGTLPEDYVCDACQLVFDPIGPGGPGDHCYIDPETGDCMPEEVNCFQQDVTMSVMRNEILPIRWDIESDVIDTVSSCSGPSDEGKILVDTLRCSFEIQHANQVVATLPVMKCDTNDRGGAEMFQPFEAILQEGVVIDPGRSFVELSQYVPYNAPLGEYKIKMTSIDFDYCGPNGQILKSHTENCCMANFALTDHYLMQIGTVTAQGAGKIYGDVDVQTFEAMDGTPIFDQYGLEYYELIEAEDYEGGDAVNILIDTFVQKYDQLAVSPGDVGTSVRLRKVPGKNIFVADGTVVINESSTFDGPFTLIVTQGDLIIEGNVESNGMFVVPNGEIQFSRNGLCDGNVTASNYDDWETIFGRQVVNGIFITKVGFNSVSGEDPVLNNDVNKPRCFGGGLVLRGVAIGDGLENVVASRRSDLYRWFRETNEGKQGLIYGGASVLMEQNPSLWIESPDGLEDLENILRLYRR